MHYAYSILLLLVLSMSQTLGTNADKGREGNSSPLYLMQITLYDGGDTTVDYYWANRAITVEAQAYEDKFAVKGLGKFKSSINLVQGGGIGEVGGLSFKLKNPGATFLSDTLFTSSLNWANALVEVRLTFDDNYLAYDAQTANFTVGDILSGGTSLATARILQDWDDGTTGVLRLGTITGTFQDNETITDEHTGSATSDGVVKAASWTDGAKLSKFYIESPNFDVDNIAFKCIDSWHKRHRKLGKILSKEGFASNKSGLPEEHIGAIAPIIYGDFTGILIHREGIGYYSDGTDYGNPQDFVKILLAVAGKDPSFSDKTVVIAGHDINEFTDLQLKFLGKYNEKLRGLTRTRLSYNGATVSYTGGFYQAVDCNNSGGGGTYGIDVDLIPYYYAKNGIVSNQENCIDEDETNYTGLTEEAESPDGWIEYRIPREKLQASIEGSGSTVAVLYWKGTITGSYTDDLVKVTCSMEDGTNFAEFKDNNKFTGVTLGVMTLVNPTFDFTGSDYDYLTIKLEYWAQAARDDITFNFANLFLRLNSPTNEQIEFHHPVKGREYGSWIDDADPARDSDKNSGDLIERPGGIVESLLHDELELANYDSSEVGEIDTDAFDELEDERDTWKFASELLEAKESLESIDQIAYEGCFGFVQKENGTETVFDFDVTGSPQAITLANVVRWKGNKPQIKLKQTPIGEVRNRFFLHYKKNMATDEYEEILFVDHTDESVWDSAYANLASAAETYWNKCADVSGGAYDKYGLLKTWEYNADWIRNAATAELFLKKMIDWLTRQHWIVEYETFLDAIDLEIGGQKKLTGAIIPNHLDNSTVFILVGKELNPKESTIKLTWLDIGT